MADLAHYYKELLEGKRRGAGDRLLFAVLRGASPLYALVLGIRAFCYRTGIFRSHRLPRPVISVGNIVLGGTGKTPMTAWIARYLIARGKRVAVLSRGYGGSARGGIRIVCDGTRLLCTPQEAGDEPCLLARMVPGLMVVIGADRYRAGMRGIEELDPDVFILDDGYQHLRLKRDLNILLLDASRPLAGGVTLPAGYLREAPSAAGRADLVVYTRTPSAGERPNLFPHKRSCWTKHQFSGIVPLAGGEPTGFDAAKGARIMAFCGIADPESFYSGLEEAGVRLVTTLSFPDHASYTEPELAAIKRLKVASRSTVLLTTQKDAVKLVPFADELGGCFAVVMELAGDMSPLEELLQQLPDLPRR